MDVESSEASTTIAKLIHERTLDFLGKLAKTRYSLELAPLEEDMESYPVAFYPVSEVVDETFRTQIVGGFSSRLAHAIHMCAVVSKVSKVVVADCPLTCCVSGGRAYETYVFFRLE